MPNFVTEQVSGDGRRALAVDVFKPVKPNGVAVILLHGGGWVQGDRSATHLNAAALADLGFVALAAEYRLLGEAPWPAAVEDVRDVVRWTKANAAGLGIDANKVALQGFSAGAHLALLVAATQPGSGREGAIGRNCVGSDVAAVVSFFAPGRLDANPEAFDKPPLSLMLGGGGAEAARAISPVHLIGPRFPTTFLLGGMADYAQPLSAGLKLLKAFTDAGAAVEFHYLHAQVHEFAATPSMAPAIMEEVAFFYRRTLLEREALEAEAREHNIFARADSLGGFIRLMIVTEIKTRLGRAARAVLRGFGIGRDRGRQTEEGAT